METKYNEAVEAEVLGELEHHLSNWFYHIEEKLTDDDFANQTQNYIIHETLDHIFQLLTRFRKEVSEKRSKEQDTEAQLSFPFIK